MRKNVIATFTTLALACIASIPSALAAEQNVTLQVDGKKVVGTLNIPDNVKAPPVALLLHGFTGSRDELAIPSADNEGIFRRTARMFADKGIASLRIDFFGSGESEGSYADTTLQGQIADAMAAVDFLSARTDVDAKKISLVGWSLGGTISAVVAGRSKTPIASVSLWQPANNPANAMAFLLGTDVVTKGVAAGDAAVEAKLPWGSTISLKGPFFRSLTQIDPVAEIVAYQGPLLVTAGINDAIVFPQPEAAQVFLDYHQGPEELWTRPMDHSFNSFQDHATVDELINKTADFIEKASK